MHRALSKESYTYPRPTLNHCLSSHPPMSLSQRDTSNRSGNRAAIAAGLLSTLSAFLTFAVLFFKKIPVPGLCHERVKRKQEPICKCIPSGTMISSPEFTSHGGPPGGGGVQAGRNVPLRQGLLPAQTAKCLAVLAPLSCGSFIHEMLRMLLVSAGIWHNMSNAKLSRIVAV